MNDGNLDDITSLDYYDNGKKVISLPTNLNYNQLCGTDRYILKMKQTQIKKI
jgi:hypothetical protein